MTDASQRFVREPVGWLLGPDLVGKLKKILRHRADPRDWMPYYRGSVHDECWKRDGSLVKITAEPGGMQIAANETSGGSAEQLIDVPAPAAGSPESESEIWFDYVADMGDGGDAMYAIAYATMISLKGTVDTTTWTTQTPYTGLTPVEHVANETIPPTVAIDTTLRAEATQPRVLPRGSFLFIGGDTAYHVADGPTLRTRVEEPFGWAFTDAQANLHIRAGALATNLDYRVYGIPGNHDWYDNLDGFSLVFRIGSPSNRRREDAVDPIVLPQFARVQLASYCAIQLPYGWQLWGLDIDTEIDARQCAYFKSLGRPERLILATPSPAIVFGGLIPNKNHKGALETLELPLATADAPPPTPAHRLDLSGDVHHYARYYPNDKTATYGSVVSGLGGAFHHPTFTRATGETQVPPVREYPTPAESRASVGARLLRLRSTWIGSWGRVLPFALTVICAFAATRSAGGGWILDRILSWFPHYEIPDSADGKTQLLRAICAIGVLGVAALGIWLAIKIGAYVDKASHKHPEKVHNILELLKNTWRLRRPSLLFTAIRPTRSYWFAWVVGSLFITPLALYALWAPETKSLRLDVAVLVIVLLPAVAGGVGVFLFGKHLAPFGRLLVTLTGLVHGCAQVVTAILIARLLVDWDAVIYVAAALLVATVPLLFARILFPHEGALYTFLLSILAAGTLVVSLGLIVYGAREHYVMPGRLWYDEALRFFGCGVVAMPFGTTWFIWYLAVAGRLNAHNNEVGGAARVSKYRELIRFHVHKEGLTGYVIAVENDKDSPDNAANVAGKNLTFKLIDVFTIPAPPPNVVAKPSTPTLRDVESGAPI